MTTVDGRWRAALLTVWAAFILYAVGSVAAVPFHPDEATFIYMSRDFDLLFLEGRPSAVSWAAIGQPDLVRRYRLLDAPLGRYLAGLGRAVAGQPYLTADWNWSANWAENLAAGALPVSRTLTAARWPAALLTGLSAGLVYALGQRLGGRPVGVAAALLYALSGLVLLHGRRAMSEGPLLFFTLLTVWTLARERPSPVLAALTLAAAVAAKLTALTLVPVAVVALLWADGEHPTPWLRRSLPRLLLFFSVFGLSLWALHPSLWSAPLAGLDAMRAARQTFFAEQAAALQAIAPQALLTQPGLRLLALFYHVFVAPLAYYDVGNYTAATAAAERAYAAVAVNTGWHTASLTLNFVLGGLLLALTLIGLIQAVRAIASTLRKPPLSAGVTADEAQAGRARWLLAVWTAASVAGLLAVAAPAQRYYLPLVPIACLWAAAGLVALMRPLRRLTPPMTQSAPNA